MYELIEPYIPQAAATSSAADFQTSSAKQNCPAKLVIIPLTSYIANFLRRPKEWLSRLTIYLWLAWVRAFSDNIFELKRANCTVVALETHDACDTGVVEAGVLLCIAWNACGIQKSRGLRSRSGGRHPLVFASICPRIYCIHLHGLCRYCIEYAQHNITKPQRQCLRQRAEGAYSIRNGNGGIHLRTRVFDTS